MAANGQIKSLEEILDKHIPAAELKEVKRILYGSDFDNQLPIPKEVEELAAKHRFEVKAYKKPCPAEQMRPARVVRIGLIQNSIAAPTDAPIKEQFEAIRAKVEKMIDAAGALGVNVLCLQEAWTMPFAFCTREKQPWTEFAEDAKTGMSSQFIRDMARKYKMVIVSPILERDDNHSGTLHNTAVVFGPNGNYIGKSRKNHIPRVGDFNESTYYMEGNTGHPVFETQYGRIGINICYGRHHPLNWTMYGLNGAEIIFNPSATVGALSEPMWAIEQRNASIFTNTYVGAINRVGTEVFPNEFTSANGKPAHKDFGHFYGSSYVAAPDASRCPGLSRTMDGLLVTEVDLNLCRQVKDRWMLQHTMRLPLYAHSFRNVSHPNYQPQIVRDNGVDGDERATAAHPNVAHVVREQEHYSPASSSHDLQLH